MVWKSHLWGRISQWKTEKQEFKKMCFQMLDRRVTSSESICHNPVFFS